MSGQFDNKLRAAVLISVFGLLSLAGRAEQTKTQLFDHSDYDSVLKAFVNEKAMVNYTSLKVQRRQLDAFAASMGKLTVDVYESWNERDQIAFWLNAYNALTLKAIIDNYPIKSSFFKSRVYPKNSIRQIPGVWKKLTFKVMGKDLTLHHIEHEILRKKFDEPRIHMAMVCAAMGCPPLRNEPYEGDKLEEQLDDQSRRFLSDPGKFKIDRRNNAVSMSEILKWFAGDFVNKYGVEQAVGKHKRKESAVLNFSASYLPEPQRNYVLAGKFKIKYLKYDWSLNEQRAKKQSD